MSGPFEGLLLLDKPGGPTSHDLVEAVRRITGQRRVGHTGTLDPLATGLLVLVLGRATRLARFLPQSPKHYSGTLELGWTSDTDDVTGVELGRHAGRLPDRGSVRTAALGLLGPARQTPPAFSARKVGGRRLYQLARRGLPVSAPTAAVEIFGFDLEAGSSERLFRFSASVSSGTYVRALVRDLGRRLDCGAVLASLRRTAIGPMDLRSALPVKGPDGPRTLSRESIAQALVPLERMPLEPATWQLATPDEARCFAQGRHIPVAEEVPGTRRVLDPAGRLLGVAELKEGLLMPRVVLAADAAGWPAPADAAG